jgi:hypothetical protein
MYLLVGCLGFSVWLAVVVIHCRRVFYAHKALAAARLALDSDNVDDLERYAAVCQSHSAKILRKRPAYYLVLATNERKAAK